MSAVMTVGVAAEPSIAQAQGFDLSAMNPFNWFGSPPVAPRPDALPYSVTVAGAEAPREAASAVAEASILQQSRSEAPVTGDELARRVEADLPRITDAMWARGYYAAAVTIRVGPAAARIGATDLAQIARTAERFRNAQIVPIAIDIVPGPQYRLSSIAAIDSRSGSLAIVPTPSRASFFGSWGLGKLPPAGAAPPSLGISPGDPAATPAILGAATRLSDQFRNAGHPLVKVGRRQPVIDHRSRTVDLVLTVDPGPVAPLGQIALSGTKDVDPAVVRSFLYAEPGDPYSPKALSDIRKSVSRIEALGAVRVKEAEALDAQGRLPISVEVTERPSRLVGASARYSTVDGPALRAYWAHRNLFGGAERLRLDADVFYTILDRDGRKRNLRFEDVGGRFAASFLKPALGGTRFDLLADASVERSRTEAYDADIGLTTLAIRRRFTDTFNVQLGLEAELGRIRQAPAPLFAAAPRAQIEYGLIGLPLGVNYDSTDRPLDPTTGIKLTASVAPYAGFGDAPPAFGIGRIQASVYYAVDPAARLVLAARAAFGSVVGGKFDEIPPTRRFFAGGGGSVRGYDFRSLSPRDAFGRLVGGRSLVEGSLEARIKVTETIGIVPFVDVGQAYAGSLPDASEKLRIGAGLGLRYYTSLGPIRVDVAVPVERRRGERPYALYVSIGQAF